GSALGALWGLALQGLRTLAGAGGRLLRLALGLGQRAAVGFAELVLRRAAAVRAGWTAIGGLAGLIRYARGGAKWGLRQLGKGAAAFGRLVFGGIRKAPALGLGLLAGLGLAVVHWASKSGVPSKLEEDIKKGLGLFSKVALYLGDRVVYDLKFNEALESSPNGSGWRIGRWFIGGRVKFFKKFAPYFWQEQKKWGNWADAAQDAYDGVGLVENVKSVWDKVKDIKLGKPLTFVGRLAMRVNLAGAVTSVAFGIWDISMDIRKIVNVTDDKDRGQAAFEFWQDLGMMLGGLGLTISSLAALSTSGLLGGALGAAVGALATTLLPFAVPLAVGGLIILGAVTALKWWDLKFNGGELTESVGRGIRNGIAWIKSLPGRAVDAVKETVGKKAADTVKDVGREAGKRAKRWIKKKVQDLLYPKPPNPRIFK
ncbi:MAG: hypothetical protein KM312_00425, partial [Hydrogenibacillus schlegelii]|nr:hypothetical protein [Hydrogenibacillus schlegelii]